MYRTLVQGLNSLRRNLLAGLQLALPLRAHPNHLNPSLGQFVAILCGLWLLSATHDQLDAGLDAEYSGWGLLTQATMSYLWMATLALIVLLDRRPGDFLRLAVSMGSASIWLLTTWTLTTAFWSRLQPEFYDENYQMLWQAFLIWELLVFARIMFSVLGAAWYRAAANSVIYAVCIYATVIFLPHSALFVEPWQPQKHSRVDVEATYYAQTNLLRQSLYILSPERPDKTDLYFVGFAAYASQDVFKREIEQATVIFEQQFDAIGRTVSLINHRATLAIVPLANRHNLETTIRGLAERINLEEDVVVLFLSSHGGEDATISVDLPNFRLNDLSANELRQMLDTAAIKWRIIIVSACYSGSFIDELKSPTTLVITAAASDRASFGCAHENDWTYFGEAYFAQALKQSASFVAAFTKAQEIIGKREADERKTPSDPQISLGSEIEAFLIKHDL
jgi:hypothetical protein